MTASVLRSVLLSLVLATICSCIVVLRPHPNFLNAGKTPGLEIWRIENFEPVKQPENTYGKFFTGDSYIVLKTQPNEGNSTRYNIHYWLGSETTQDEAGATAFFTTNLPDALHDKVTYHRELQNHESNLFRSYFVNGLNYVSGGIDTGFKHAETNSEGEKRLFQVSGTKDASLNQVNLSRASINEEDCFILDAGKHIYVYVGLNSSRTERRKAFIQALKIREQDHNGRSQIEAIDEYSSRKEERENFFNILDSKS